MKKQGIIKRVITFVLSAAMMVTCMGVKAPISVMARGEKTITGLGTGTNDSDIISVPVTFKVVGGGWNKDGSTEDIVVTLTRRADEDKALVLSEDDVPTAGDYPGANYKKPGSWDVTPNIDKVYTEATTYTYSYTAKAPITPMVSMSGYVYGSPSTPDISGNTGNGAVTYFYSSKNQSAGGTKWVVSAPPELNAGTYYMYAEVAETDDYASAVTQPVTFMVSNAGQAVIVEIPTANNRLYDGTEKPLLNQDGSASGGMLVYALGADSATAPDASAYTEAIPGAIKTGNYYVWCKAAGDANHTDSAAICVEARISESDIPSISLDDSTLSLKEGTEKKLTATVVPEKTEVKWTSDNESVATVDTTGLVKAISEGTARIKGTITVDGVDYSAECTVTVTKDTPQPTDTGITLNMSELFLYQGREKALTAKTVPAGTPVTWTSSDMTVAYVTPGGVVTGLKLGTAVITATITVDGKEYSASCKVTVVPETYKDTSTNAHTHKYVWDTIEATEDMDGELRYQCEICGDIKERVPLTAYNVFNKNTTEKIRKAPKDATVKIETSKWISFHKMVMEALAERPDVTLEISFLDEGHKGNRYKVVIPKGTDTKALIDKNGFTGFLSLGGKYGMTPQ